MPEGSKDMEIVRLMHAYLYTHADNIYIYYTYIHTDNVYIYMYIFIYLFNLIY